MKTRGAAPALLLPVLAVCCIIGIFVPNARPWHWSIFQKKAPTAQVTDAVQAQKDAQAKLEAALAAQKAVQAAQVMYSQEMLSPVPRILARAPQTPDVIFATSLVNRAKIGLTEAIGSLPEDKRMEIEQIVDNALSDKQAEVDNANAKLAAMDKQLGAEVEQRKAIEAKLPVLTADRDAATAKADTAIKNVVTYADNLAAKEKEAGSLSALAGNLGRLLVFVLICWLVVHFVLPSLAAEFPASAVLTTANRWTKSIFSSHP